MSLPLPQGDRSAEAQELQGQSNRQAVHSKTKIVYQVWASLQAGTAQ